jgi:hypothetical protein
MASDGRSPHHLPPYDPPTPRQLPANLVMVRVGYRRWLAFLMFGWGVVSTSFMFINSVGAFYTCRLLLGIFESGASA